jgi:hypothetical protein
MFWLTNFLYFSSARHALAFPDIDLRRSWNTIASIAVTRVAFPLSVMGVLAKSNLSTVASALSERFRRFRELPLWPFFHRVLRGGRL